MRRAKGLWLLGSLIPILIDDIFKLKGGPFYIVENDNNVNVNVNVKDGMYIKDPVYQKHFVNIILSDNKKIVLSPGFILLFDNLLSKIYICMSVIKKNNGSYILESIKEEANYQQYSSVGNSIPKLRKLFALDSKSVNSKFISFIGKIEFITTKLSCCFD